MISCAAVPLRPSSSPRWKALLSIALLLTPITLLAQRGAQPASDDNCGATHLRTCVKDLLQDQVGIFTSPLRTSRGDLPWLVPLAGATALAIAYDADALREVGPTGHGRLLIDAGNTISDFGSPHAALAEGAILYGIGAVAKNEKLRKTGVLGMEAVADASIVTAAIKLATDRQRPNQGNGNGDFWSGGTKDYKLDSSFPSGHTSASWALARVVAGQYHGWLPRIGAYSFATLISANRITSRSHFPSDVVVGSAIGYLVGGYVERHHSPESQQHSSITVLPVYEGRTQTYGVALSFSPRGLR